MLLPLSVLILGACGETVSDNYSEKEVDIALEALKELTSPSAMPSFARQESEAAVQPAGMDSSSVTVALDAVTDLFIKSGEKNGGGEDVTV